MATSAFLPTPLRGGWLDPEAVPKPQQQALWRFRQVLEQAEDVGIGLRLRPLSVISNGWLVQGSLPGAATGFGFGLWTPQGFTELDGTAVPIYEVCDLAELRFSAEAVLEYAALFSRFVYSDDGPFWLVTAPDDLNASTAPGEDASGELPELPVRYDRLTDEQLRRLIEPPALDPRDGGWRVEVCLQSGSGLDRGQFQVGADGAMELLGDVPLVTGISPVRKRNELPRTMNLGARPATRLEPLVPHAHGRALSGKEKQEMLAAMGVTPVPKSPNERSRGRSLLQQCLRLQLLRALRRGEAEPLFSANPGRDDDELLADFAAFLVRGWPAVVLETPYPLAEQTVALMLVDTLEEKPKNNLTQQTVPGEPDVIGIPAVGDHDMLALSFHAARKLLRPEAVAFHLGATENLTFIGCNFLSDLPPALQRMADIVLCLGSLDAALFRQLFCLAFECDWPAGADLERELWLRYVEPQDLERPLRDKQERPFNWQPADAIAAVRARVERRLASIGTEDAPDLDALHGLDTAKAVIRDLIDDLRGAVAGQLDWADVDRGLLLVGEPGTGKTMLARAAAKAAGVHFISTSAGRWGANATEFADVIRTIREVFAEAQRYAPSILFIDELDSLGRRDQMTDRNRQLELEELNTVLQELQGFRDRQGVFVIGATNHLDRIDPALTRAGRLDQVVRIPRPNRAALAAIMRYQLAPYAAEGRVAEDLDLHALAALAVGCTGADMEAFIRDAARRARKAGGQIDAQQLAAAITRAPRAGQAGRPMLAGEQERTAFHEAGHALACLLAEHYPAELTMVSIVPRSDGSLGFAGFYSDRQLALTRAAHQDYIEILLAGRAAEELRYGPDGISSGAGGESAASDLAQATRHVLRSMTELGLHDERSLRWRGVHERAEDIGVVGELLARAYDRTRQRLADHRALLDAIAARLMSDSEVLAGELESLARRHGLPAGGRKAAAALQ